MRSTTECESARRMAQWRATGGAGLEPAGEPRCGDDGLQAAGGSFMRGDCFADDGLAPRMGTVGGAPSTLCAADDGLKAGNPSEPTGCFYGDDGLKAAGGSFLRGDCFADDGLTVRA